MSATTTLGRIVPEAGTALTDDNGVAILYVTADGIDGAGTLTAALTYNEVESAGSINFSSHDRSRASGPKNRLHHQCWRLR